MTSTSLHSTKLSKEIPKACLVLGRRLQSPPTSNPIKIKRVNHNYYFPPLLSSPPSSPTKTQLHNHHTRSNHCQNTQHSWENHSSLSFRNRRGNCRPRRLGVFGRVARRAWVARRTGDRGVDRRSRVGGLSDGGGRVHRGGDLIGSRGRRGSVRGGGGAEGNGGERKDRDN